MTPYITAIHNMVVDVAATAETIVLRTGDVTDEPFALKRPEFVGDS
jgi:hypothetical protein